MVKGFQHLEIAKNHRICLNVSIVFAFNLMGTKMGKRSYTIGPHLQKNIMDALKDHEVFYNWQDRMWDSLVQSLRQWYRLICHHTWTDQNIYGLALLLPPSWRWHRRLGRRGIVHNSTLSWLGSILKDTAGLLCWCERMNPYALALIQQTIPQMPVLRLEGCARVDNIMLDRLGEGIQELL
jgi:hypothetical protein